MFINSPRMHQSCFRAKVNILPRPSRKVSKKSVNFIFQQVLAKTKGEILPGIINDAKASGKSAAKRVFDDRRGHIMATGCIPFYGWVKAPMLIADAKRDAINDAKHAAEETVNSEFHSAAVKVCWQNLIDSNWNCNLFTHETLIFLRTSRLKNKRNSHMASTPGFESGLHWWEASAVTTTPSLTSSLFPFTKVNKRWS